MAHRGLALLFAASLCAAPRAWLIKLGADGKEGVDWSGSVSPAPSRVKSWQFDKSDELAGAAWKLKTARRSYWDTPYERSMKGTTKRDKVAAKGLIAEYDAEPAGPVRVVTAQGEFSFTAAGSYLDGRARVVEAPAVGLLTSGADADDHPSVLETRDGSTWSAWIAYDKQGDRVWAKRRVNGAWQPAEALTQPGGDLFRTALAEDKRGNVWAVWSAQVSGNFDLYGRRFDGSKWLGVERITSELGADIYHAAASDKAGNVHLAWMSPRSGNFDIYSMHWDGSKWTKERRVSESAANDWDPALAASPDGSMTVLWDTYDKGNYDIVMRSSKGGPVRPVADSGAFESRASAQYDKLGRLWIAYDEGDWNWGKDYGQGISGNGRGLMVRRQARVAIWANGWLQQPAGDLAGSVPEDFRQAFQAPKLVLDASGAPRLFFRFRVNTPQGGGGTESARTMWRLGMTRHDGAGWTPMMEFPNAYGRIDAPTAATSKLVLWTTDGREWPLGVPRDQDIAWADLPASTAANVPLVPFAPSAENLPLSHQNEARDLERIRNHRVTVDGREYRIVRGDIHRHTDISWDGNRDGSLHDAYRYAMDAAGFEYLGVCDHQAGNMIPYNWWMIQKAVDLFSIEGRFAPLYSYERSLSYPNGHRNVLFAERGKPVLAISSDEQKGVEGAAKLYEYLRRFRGVTTSHTSATAAGTDWRDSDEQLEPVVEIYQGYRRSYEGKGTPRAPTQGEEPSRFEAGFVWNAWAKGIKMGVQSSSDHVSTHISYAALYVDKIERQAILDAIRARRAYAATDNIVVDLRMGQRFMGEAFQADGNVPLSANVIGTGPIDRVDVIKNNKVVFSHPGSGSTARFDFADADPGPGERYYYIRVMQKDIQLAWSSPIWVK